MPFINEHKILQRGTRYRRIDSLKRSNGKVLTGKECPEITSSASPSHSARMSLIFAVTRNVARAAGSSRSTRTWPSWGHWQGYRDIGMSQLPSHVSVKTLSSAIEIGIKNSFSSLNRVPKGFNHMSITTQHALRHQDGHHISLVPLPLEVPRPHSKAAKQEKSLDQNAHVYYKMIFWGWAGRAKSGIFQLFSALGHRYGTLSPCFPVPRAPASWSPLEVPGQHKHAQTPCNQEMNWSWLVDSQFDSCDEQEVLHVLILQRKGKHTWGENMVHFRVTCFHMFSMKSQQQLSSGSWTFSTDFRSLSCLEVVSVTQVPRWGKLFWKSGEVKTKIASRFTRFTTPCKPTDWQIQPKANSHCSPILGR